MKKKLADVCKKWFKHTIELGRLGDLSRLLASRDCRLLASRNLSRLLTSFDSDDGCYFLLLLSRGISLLAAGGGKGTLKPPMVTLETGSSRLGGLWIDMTHVAALFA